MAPVSKRRLHLASIAQAGNAASKRLKIAQMEKDRTILSEFEEGSDDQWEVDESGDSNVSSNSDDDEVLYLLYT
jgi:hypothetical protein